jgi:hypothetical protein
LVIRFHCINYVIRFPYNLFSDQCEYVSHERKIVGLKK